jgi:hypothetical protein
MLHTDDAVVNRTSAPGATRPLDYRVVLAGAVLPFLVLAIWRAFHGTGLAADDFGQYLMHAQALAEGRPYGDTGYIYSKYARWIGPRLAPPGLPVTLAPFLFVFGASPVVLKAVMLAFSLAFVILATLYFVRRDDLKVGLGVGLLVGLTPELVHSSSQILTDLPFAALLWAVIYIVDRPGAFTAKRILAVTLLGAYAVAFRTTGVVLVPALLLYTVLRYREYGLRPAVPVVIWLSGYLTLRLVTSVSQAALINTHPGKIYEWIFVAQLPLKNGVRYAAHLVSSFTNPMPWPAANYIFHAVATLLMLVGLAVWLPHAYKRFVVALSLSYIALILILPLSQGRYLWPLYPLFLFGLLNGVRVVAEKLARPQLARWAAPAFALVLVPLAAATVVRAGKPADLTDVPDVHELFSFLEGQQAVGEVRTTFYKPRTLAWTTGVAAMGPLNGELRCLLTELERKRITHVVVGRVAGSYDTNRTSDMRRVVAEWPARFDQQFANETFTVYRFIAEPALNEEMTSGC